MTVDILAHPELMTQRGLCKRLYDRQYGLMEDLYINPGEEPPSETGREL